MLTWVDGLYPKSGWPKTFSMERGSAGGAVYAQWSTTVGGMHEVVPRTSVFLLKPFSSFQSSMLHTLVWLKSEWLRGLLLGSLLKISGRLRSINRYSIHKIFEGFYVDLLFTSE